MSNQSPTTLTPFQQKALTRIQTMEVETRQMVYEKMRELCREEMRGALSELLTATPASTPQMEALAQQQQQTQRLLADVADKMEKQRTQPKADVMAKEAAKAVRNVMSESEERGQLAAQNLMNNLRENQQVMKRTGWKMMAGTALAVVAVVVLLLSGLWLAGRNPKVLTEAQQQEERYLTERLAELRAAVKQTEEKIVQRKGELLQLEDQKAKVDTSLQAMAETQQTQARTLAELNVQMTKLQQLQEQFRFKVVPGLEGTYVEVPPNTMPFIQGRQTLIKVN